MLLKPMLGPIFPTPDPKAAKAKTKTQLCFRLRQFALAIRTTPQTEADAALEVDPSETAWIPTLPKQTEGPGIQIYAQVRLCAHL